jgi:hypothetical protein
VLGPEFPRFRKYEVNCLKSVVFLNRGEHFEVRELPREAQLTPVFSLAAADFDLDGRQDLFLGQNFFATRPRVPRLDAGRGLLLRGNGLGGFTSLDASESGIYVYGEARAAAVGDFNRDGKPDLVVTQNGSTTRLFLNNAPRPNR